ncbi:left-handed beta-roll domain-containing protein [Mannheimia haemolytica]|nr:left-handed beta-roll domain-containing protein [Mannheimia haemolytica]
MKTSSENAIAFGTDSQATSNNAIALGANSKSKRRKCDCNW